MFIELQKVKEQYEITKVLERENEESELKDIWQLQIRLQEM